MGSESLTYSITDTVLAMDAPAGLKDSLYIRPCEERLKQHGFRLLRMPSLPNIPDWQLGHSTEELKASRAILAKAGGLVVADYQGRNRMVVELDKSVVAHIALAGEMDVPVFLPAPLEDIAPLPIHELPEAELFVGISPNKIISRLEGEL
ncbi:MAG TPA: hypothetical protein VHC21_03120 [Candidatus Saccharimonadales bacterium]|nr:hypothetical protein [Candidatus Saccharimonadales bacterium]